MFKRNDSSSVNIGDSCSCTHEYFGGIRSPPSVQYNFHTKVDRATHVYANEEVASLESFGLLWRYWCPNDNAQIALVETNSSYFDGISYIGTMRT